jgi:hypothetical protein
MPNTIAVKDLQHLGRLIRAARKSQRLRQDEVGAFSHSFIGEVELGKPTAQIGKVFEALRELGLKVHIELPPGVEPAEPERAEASRK